MVLILMKNDEMLAMPMLLRLALKLIYEEDIFSFEEQRQLHKSIIHWKQYLDAKREGEYNAVDEENQIALELIASMLKNNEQGGYAKRKVMFKEKDIDYKKFHRLHEAYDVMDFVDAQKASQKHKETNPEDYE